MKPPICARSAERVPRHRLESGQILAEAAIGLSLLAFLWILMAFMTYMANNRIRTAMAARDAAWLQSNGESLTGVPSMFFSGNEVALAKVSQVQQVSFGAVGGPWGGSVWSTTVTFGVQPGSLSGTSQFPFDLLNVHVPFMGKESAAGGPNGLGQLSSVNSVCAWPSDTSDTWTSLSDALIGGFSIPAF